MIKRSKKEIKQGEDEESGKGWVLGRKRETDEGKRVVATNLSHKSVKYSSYIVNKLFFCGIMEKKRKKGERRMDSSSKNHFSIKSSQHSFNFLIGSSYSTPKLI